MGDVDAELGERTPHHPAAGDDRERATVAASAALAPPIPRSRDRSGSGSP